METEIDMLKSSKKRRRLNLSLGTRLTLSIGGIICLIILVTFGWLYRVQERNTFRQLETQTQALLSEMLIIREWVAQYKGVWTTEPGYIHLENRGEFYRKSPAMVTKELSLLADNTDEFSFHITSLHLKNPDNAPDAFERQALHMFEENASPISCIELIDGQRFYRYMVPLRTTASCLECHEDQGYHVGDIRGGLSVMVPMTTADQVLAASRRTLIISALLTVVLAMGTLYLLVRRFVVAPLGHLEQAALAISQEDLNVHCDIHTGDELEMLGNAFNQMVSNLQASRTALQDKVEQRTRELASLSEIALIISQSEALGDVLDDALTQVIQVTATDAGSIHLIRSGGRLELVAEYKMPASIKDCMSALAGGEGLPAQVIEEVTPFLFSDLTTGPPHAGCRNRKTCSAADEGYRTLVSVPLRTQNRTFGTLTLFSREVREMGSELMQFLTCTGNQLGIAVENVRYQEQVEQMAILEERTRIARELHDNQAQMMGYLNLRMRAIADMLKNDQISQASDELQNARSVIKDAYEEIRHSIFDLRFSVPANGGLGTALQQYLNEYTLQCGVETALAPDDPAPWFFPPEVEVQILRIIQEALTNIRRHANATFARVSLIVDDAYTMIRIEDNGWGLPSGRETTTGRPRFGLQIMRERAESVGGQLRIGSSEWGGALIEIELPKTRT